MLKGLMIAAITITLVITTIVLNNDFDYIQHGDAKLSMIPQALMTKWLRQSINFC